jgi:hypothetical protein
MAHLIVEGKFVTAVMTITTLYALIGDDIRLWLTTKDADVFFGVGFVLSLILFSLELLLNSTVVEGFKYSFFFWLDIIATLSLIPDISWIMHFLAIIVTATPANESRDVVLGSSVGSSTAGTRAQRLIKSVRLIRLIRIIKLYKYAVKSNTEEEEAILREQQKLSQTAQQAALKREMEPSRLGKVMSDTTIRKVIIGILIMLMVLPIITYSGIDYTFEYGLDKMFWFGRSTCENINGEFYCARDDWVTTDGWNQLVKFYSDSSKTNEEDDVAMKLLWMYAPDYTQSGKMTHINNVTIDGKLIWSHNSK